MAFTDVIDNYANGATGTLTATNGSVGYSIVSTANTVTTANTDQGARITADGQATVQVTFDQLVRGVTLSIDRSNPGEIYLIEINGQPVNIQTLIDNGDAVFTTTLANTNPPQPGTHVITNGGITSTGSFDNNSLGFLQLLIPVETIRVIGSGGNNGNFDIIEIGIDSTDFTIVCFAADTDLQTPQGPRPVRDLKAGDKVVTVDGKVRTIMATQQRQIRPLALFRETRLLPVLIKAGALGGGLPLRDLRVSRQHRILLASRIARRILGQTEVLIPAIRLVGLPGIDVDRSMQQITYHHIMLDRHDVVLANGAPAETLFAGPLAAQAIQDGPEDAGCEAFFDPDAPAMVPARPFPTAKQARQIVAAHLRQQRPLLETLHYQDS